LETGFSEQSHFNRVFRSLTGATPAVWRRSQ
jgi:AraC-like DNA-binding protein